MDYANFSKRPFVVKKEIQKRKKVSPELKRRREFFASHSLKIFVDPATNEVKLEVRDRDGRLEGGPV